MTDFAQLCVTELATDVLTHVGPGTPTTLAVSMAGVHLRIEIHDPDARALPTLLAATDGDESGRGIAIIDTVTDRWGVILRADSKVTWCELPTTLIAPSGHTSGRRVTWVEMPLVLHHDATHPPHGTAGPLGVAVAEEVAIDLIPDLLHWLRAHGCDPDETLDRARTRFECGRGEVPGWGSSHVYGCWQAVIGLPLAEEPLCARLYLSLFDDGSRTPSAGGMDTSACARNRLSCPPGPN
ncbi:ATP-binding protein [Streptomyces agglomeratus]|uniref:ATP-binding protein n=1 Tax=Streptomyces agglomeratus TaxID=285458 RepID=UPI0034E56938